MCYQELYIYIFNMFDVLLKSSNSFVPRNIIQLLAYVEVAICKLLYGLCICMGR